MTLDKLKSLFDIDLYGIVTMDFADAWQRIREVLYDPSSDPAVAWLVFGILSMFVAAILLAGIVYILGTKEDAEEQEYEAFDEEGNPVLITVEPEPVVVVEPVVTKRSGVMSIVFGVVTLALVWAALALGTSTDDVCLGCHTATPHQMVVIAGGVKPADSHESLACVDCHESGGGNRWGIGTIGRTGHILSGFESSKTATTDDYGVITPRACLRCHSQIETTVVRNEAKGIAVSHAEPLEAGAKCLDCHPLSNGVVKSGIEGHTRCVRCHNGVKAPSACDSCHIADVSLASSAPRSADTTQGRQIIGTPDCGGCHDVAKSCDPCHGIRLPHSENFIRGEHARPAVESYWSGDGKACVKCHNENRRPCGTCHQGRMWSHAKSWRIEHQTANPSGMSCIGCHNGTVGTLPNRNFCIDTCHTDREEWRGN